MSIRLEDFHKIEEKHRKIKEKVIAVLGVDVINDNHYGDTLLFNQEINIKTEDSKIIEIWNKYVDLYKELENIFKKNNIELKDEYFFQDPMSGFINFLGVTIDVYKGLSLLEPAVIEFISLYKKIHTLAFKYSNLGKIMFKKELWSKNNFYYLYNQKIEYLTEEYILENILSSFDKLNKKVNELLTICNYKDKDILYPAGNNIYYLFGKEIKHDITNEDLIKLINTAQLFESNVKCVLKELKIIEQYTIIHERDIFITFGGTHHGFDINMSYDKIKQDFIETDKWCNFKKSI